MFPESNAPIPSQAWVRDVSDRASAAQRHSTMTERNAYALAGNVKTAYELIDNRIANIDTFTNGLFEQKAYTHEVTSYAALDAVPTLYDYTDGSYQEYAVTTHTIPFAQYNDLTITGDGSFIGYTTDATATDISITRPIRPMIQATIPPLGLLLSDGRYFPNSLSYASRWTVENFEPFTDYNIPGNSVASAYSSWYGQVGPAYFPPSGLTSVNYSIDGYTSYAMHYTREWLMDYMDAILRYTTANTPPPAGGRYLAPDVNLVDIKLGYYYHLWIGSPTTVLFLDDARLNYTAGATFSLQGTKNMGY